MSETENMMVGNDTVVAFHYTLTDDAGNTLDTTEGGDPMEYLHGAENIVPGLEQAMAGHRAGDALTAVVPPELGYGVRDAGSLRKVPRNAFGQMEPRPGMRLATRDDDGNVVPIWIAEVGPEEVVIDFAHPLAGKTLNFKVEVVSVRGATVHELRHGHPEDPNAGHGCGSCGSCGCH